MTDTLTIRAYRLGEFILDLERQSLSGPGGEIELRPKSWNMLRYLAEHAGSLVSKDDLRLAIWGHSVVTEASITQCIVDIRRALGDDERSQLRTIPRRGYLLETPVSPLESATGVKARVPRVRRAASLGAALAMTVALALLSSPREEPAVPASPTTPVIAVMPFEDLGPEGSDAWFGDGLAEETLDSLTRLKGVHVIARTSSFSLRGQPLDVRQIADRLNASHVLEGSVRRVGDQARITAQLIDGDNARHLWSQTFDITMDDVFDVQQGIARSLADVLELEFLDPQAQPTSAMAAEAWAHYRRGLFLYNRRNPGDLELARQAYENAIKADPSHGLSWAGISAIHHLEIYSGEHPARSLRMMAETASRALELAPNDATVLMRAACAAIKRGDWIRADALFNHARQVAPDDPLLLAVQAGRLFESNDMDAALDLQRRAAALNPLAMSTMYNLVVMETFAGNYQAALDLYETLHAMNPGSAAAVSNDAAIALLSLGNVERALSVLAAVGHTDPGSQAVQVVALEAAGDSAGAGLAFNELVNSATTYEDRLAIASVHAWRGATNEALDHLRDALQMAQADAPTNWSRYQLLLSSTLFSRISGHPDFRQHHAEVVALDRLAVQRLAAEADALELPELALNFPREPSPAH
ncbi:tetratricopeptide repeat protein [Marinihelvus fidelis]|uniref:Tetratricopeptide repeat protein n=1 Tax=Marinihelvus fidelis TaxID=2613842 RepID=A0A5N0TG33_9GAMM|nr:winged helix-turn-helix domain-containing protein [Marinihelvus fidelis]KAA9133438.1 tetratricopeptide repeat protein [Marinihelvus fidelis]